MLFTRQVGQMLQFTEDHSEAGRAALQCKSFLLNVFIDIDQCAVAKLHAAQRDMKRTTDEASRSITDLVSQDQKVHIS